MGKVLKNKRFFYIFTLFFIAGFLVSPNVSLAVEDEFDDITLRETAKYLELPGGKVQDLIRSFINLFHSEWIDLVGSGYVTAEKMAVPSIMKKAVQVQALNHLLIDAPIETSWAIIKNTVKMTRLFLGDGFGSIFEEIEKESVKRAIAYGMNTLFEGEIRMSPGPIEFEYKLRGGEIEKALIQYIMIYKPYDNKSGEMMVRFYSTKSLKPPENKGSVGMYKGTYTELEHDLPPFIVEIRGNVQDYEWVGKPSVDIKFPPGGVPDLGIRPLNFLERHLLKPIETTIKDVEVIITKVTGKSPGFTDIWNEVKNFISKIKSFVPAGLTESPQIEQNQPSIDEVLELLTVIETAKGLVEVDPQQVNEAVEENPQQTDESEITLAELQEILDDAAEQIDVLTRQIAELSRAKLEESAELSQIQEQAEEQEVVKEEIEELNEEEELVEESPQQISESICWVDINAASKEELQKIIGIGPVLAQRIIETRPFYSLSDLIRVSGIGEVTLQKILNQECAYINYIDGGGGGGSSYVSPPPEPEKAPISSTSSTSTVVKILITEIQIETSTSTDYDFIELYNPTTTDVDISGWQLKKRNSAGNESSIRVLPENSIIPNQGYFLWVNAEYASSTQILADVTSSQILAATNSIAFLDGDKNIIDSVAWGVSVVPFVENLPFPQNPGADQSLGRKWSTTAQNYIDTDNNQNDFEIQNPTPKAQNQTPEPAPPTGPEVPLLTVVINEIAWMGTSATNSSDEWIELYNNTTSTIDVTNWSLTSTGGSPDITLSTSSIPDNSFYLIERSDDDMTISDIPADYKGPFGTGLSNEGEKLELRDASGTLIDVINCSSGWFAGTTTDYYASMERINSNASGTDVTNWATNNLITKNGLDADENRIYGTPKAENSVSKLQTEISGTVDYPVLTYFSNPYTVTNTLTIPYGQILVIEPGVTLKFNDNAGLEVNGTVIANGEENNKVIFTSSNEPTYWNGIYFSASSTTSELNWIEIKYGRRNPQLGLPPTILVENSSISISSSTIENYTDRGIKLINSSSIIETTEFLGSGIDISKTGIVIERGSPNIKNCSIKNNRQGIYIETLNEGDLPVIEGNNFENNEYPVYASPSEVIFKNNRGQNNIINGIAIHGSMKSDIAWYKNEIPYIIFDFVSIEPGYSLTIESGVTVKGYQVGTYGAYLEIDGKLMAEGTPEEPIVFTSYGGSWGGLAFSTTSQNSILKNVVVEYGGIWNPFRHIWGAVSVVGSSIEFIDSVSASSSEAGIYLENSFSAVQNSYFGNNKIGMMIVGTESVPQMSNNTFSGNKKCDICWANSGGRCEEIATSSPGLVVECNGCP